MRVIPDVDADAERSDKQKEENSKFGFLSGLLNSIYPYIKIGYPKIYQPLNFCLKQNLDFVLQNNGEFSLIFEKLSFSKGILETAISTDILNYRASTTGEHLIRVNYNNSGVGKTSQNANIYVITYFVESKTIHANLSTTTRTYGSQRRLYATNIEKYKNQTAHVFYFFEKNKEVSNTMYAGSLFYRW